MTDRDVIVEAVNAVLDERDRVDRATHAAHHQFVDLMMEERKMRKERMERVKTQVIGWAVITAIGSGVYIIGHWVTEAVSKLIVRHQ